MNSPSIYSAGPRRTRRGPVFACRAGVVGLEYACGCFVPGLPEAAPGAKVKDALDPLAPCPKCWPGGASYYQRTSARLPEVARA